MYFKKLLSTAFSVFFFSLSLLLTLSHSLSLPLSHFLSLSLSPSISFSISCDFHPDRVLADVMNGFSNCNLSEKDFVIL